MNWYYLKGGSWIGPIPDEEKKDLMDWGVYPRHEENFFGDLTKRENEEDWRDESDESEDYVEDWRHDPEEEDEEEETYTESVHEEEIEEENVEENEMNKSWKEEKEEKEEDLKATGKENVQAEKNEEDEDVLAVTDDDSEFWKLVTDFANVEKADEEIDELVPDSYPDDGDDLEIKDLEDELAGGNWDGDLEIEDLSGDDSDDGDYVNVSDEQKDDLAPRLDAQEERLKAIEDCLTVMRQNLGALEKLCRSRLDVLEAKTNASAGNYEKLDANLRSISVRVDAYDVNDYSTRLEAQDERLKSLEEQVEQVSQDIDGFLEDNEDRLDTLEERTETFDKTCEKITADVQALSVRVPVIDAGAWKALFDDQAEDLAIIREQIAGIERKINGATEESNRRLGALEEKTNGYEGISRDVGAKVDVFETTIQNLGKSVRTLDSLSRRVDALQKERETSGTTNSELSALKKSVASLESRTSAFQTRFGSFEKETNNADFIYEARFVKLEQTSNSFETRIQNLQNAVEKNCSRSEAMPDIEELVAELQNRGIPSEARVKNLEVVFAGFKSSLEGQGQFFLEQTRNLSQSIRSQTTALADRIKQTQSELQSLEAKIQNPGEESIGTAFMSRMNQLFTKMQRQNKETQEECRRLKEYVDEQRQIIEKLADETARKAAASTSQEPHKGSEQEETIGVAFMGRINQMFAKFQKQMKEQEEERRRFKEEIEEERRRFKEKLEEQYRAFENLGKGSKKKWRLF